jgi:hypothetical protein
MSDRTYKAAGYNTPKQGTRHGNHDRREKDDIVSARFSQAVPQEMPPLQDPNCL